MSGKKTSTRKKGSFKSFKAALPYVGTALVLLILTLAGYAVYSYISAGFKQQSMAYNWEYAYSDAPDIPIDENNIRLFGPQNAIVKDQDVVRNYIFFRRTFEATEEPFNLVIMTDHSPVRVLVNGKIIYDNHYLTNPQLYVGNCYNAVRIGGTGKSQNIRVEMGVPLSVRFEPRICPQNDLSYRFTDSSYIAAAIIAIGLLGVIISFIVTLIIKKYRHLIIIFLYVLLAGIAAAAYAVPEMTYIMNDPMVFRAFTAVQYLVLYAVVIYICAMSGKTRQLIVITAAAAILSAVLIMLSQNALLYRLSCIAAAMLAIVCLALAAILIFDRVKTRIQYAPTTFMLCVYFMMCILFTGIFTVTRSPLSAYLTAFSAIVCIGGCGYINIADKVENEYADDLLNISREHSVKISRAAQLLRDTMDCRQERAFLEQATTAIYKLLCETDEYNTGCRYSVAVRDGLTYDEIINHGAGECDYGSIKRQCELRHLSYVYSDTYYAFVFRAKKEVRVIMYFEGIHNGLDDFFISVISTLYSGLDLVYQKIVGQDMRSAEMSIFVQLAKNTDIATGTPGEHIDHVSKYVYAVCHAMEMDDMMAKAYALASKMHDIGKLAIPQYIITKPALLTDRERLIMKCHTDYGAVILSSFSIKPVFRIAAAIAMYHHEQYDGKGYHGIVGDKIPLCARITAVCDTFDALTTKRDYKEAWSFDSALQYINDNSGTVFDPQVVDAFNRSVNIIKNIKNGKES